MRIKISMLPVQDRISRKEFESYYREGVNGWIYSMIREKNPNIHGEQSPVKFCFSSLRGFDEGDTELRNDREDISKLTGKKFIKPYYFIISTPRKDVAMNIVLGMRKYLENNIIDFSDYVGIKEARFNVVDIKTYGTEINLNEVLIKDAPVIFKNYSNPKENLLPSFGKFKEVFINHINYKAKLISGKDIQLGDKIEFSLYKRKNQKNDYISLSLFKLKNGNYLKVYGPLLKLKISDDLSFEDKKLLAQVFDSGIGSYTSFGCGFVNIIKKVDNHA